MEASAITMFLNTQKNCVRRESSTMEATGLLHGYPVPACARRYLHIWRNNVPPDTPICAYYVSVGAAPKYLTGSNIVDLLRARAKQIGFQWLGFTHTILVSITYVWEVPLPSIRPIYHIALPKSLGYGGQTPS